MTEEDHKVWATAACWVAFWAFLATSCWASDGGFKIKIGSPEKQMAQEEQV